MLYVKTVYDVDQSRKPLICLFHNEVNAKAHIKMALRWGIGIETCGIISKEKALQEIESGLAEFDEVKDESD